MTDDDEIRVAVRALCEFTAKAGDLDLRFTPAPSAADGIAGHRRVAERRGAGYQRELRLESRSHGLHLVGRADGLASDPLVLEEIKTHRGRAGRIPDNHRALHRAQLRLYGAQLCRARGLASLRLSLVYFDIDGEDETRFDETLTAAELDAFHDAQAGQYAAWARQERRHRGARNAALAAVGFPHAALHPGQRRLAEAVYRTAMRGGHLLAQAPTGIGKSIGTLFPALKAMARGGIDKLFYLTAKTPGRRMALDALAALSPAARPIPLRVLELAAREQCCEHPDKACHGESCPLAKGFYDRLPAARGAAVAKPAMDRATLRAVAAEHAVCPYYLAQDLVRWADVVVGDYNYYFDQGALLHGLAAEHEWRVALLVDETHNLVERGRGMYSTALDPRRLAALRPRAPRALKPALTRLHQVWQRLGLTMEGDYRIEPAPPQALTEALQRVATRVGDYFAEHPTLVEPELQRFHFDVLRFNGLADSFGEHSIFDLAFDDGLDPARGSAPRLSLRNLVPAPFLAPRFAAAASGIAFSATLNPAHYYRDLLGLPDDTRWLDVPSPFAADQLQVRIAGGISTRYRERGGSIDPIVGLIAGQFARAPGNYLAFFSSFDYLGRVADRLAARHPEIPLWRQHGGMPEAAREQFLARFVEDGRGIGFAVLGGAFAEGIDLPGRRLIGAFIATLGLPQVNPVNEALRARLEALFGAGTGHDYAYLFPGLQKVVQAAGRVIRSTGDRGMLHLIDDRFTRRQVRALLPGWWTIGTQAPTRRPAESSAEPLIVASHKNI